MRLLVTTLLALALLACGLLACEEAPTPEYAKAKAAYQSAFAETADVTYRGARWDEVLALLKAVPTSNAKERRLAQQLVNDIEGTRARIAADLRASNENAEKLLDIKSLPPLEQPVPPTAPEPSENERIAAARVCVDACKATFESCMKAAGCSATAAKKSAEKTSMSFDCPRSETPKAVACNDTVNTCSAKCQ